MKYVAVKNWRKHQNYEGRTPSWIKLWRDLLNPVEQAAYARLSDGAKLTFIHLCLLASGTDNRTPESWVTRETLNMQTKPKLDELIVTGFASLKDIDPSHNPVIDDTMTTSSIGSKPSYSDSVSDSASFDQEESFSQVWADIISVKIPKPVRKALAEKHYRASVKDAATHQRLLVGLRFYRESERVSRGFIQDASSWFNNWQEWESNPDPIKSAVPVKGLYTEPTKGVTGDEIRSLEWELAQPEWTRPEPREIVADYVAMIRSEYEAGKALADLPSLETYAQGVRV